MIIKKESKQKKLLNENYSKKEKSNFIYGEINCLESQKKNKRINRYESKFN
jgi:hypothetical protein